MPQEYWDEAPEPRLQTNHVPPGTLAELQGLVPPGGGKGSGGSGGAANTKGGKGGGEAVSEHVDGAPDCALPLPVVGLVLAVRWSGVCAWLRCSARLLHSR